MNITKEWIKKTPDDFSNDVSTSLYPSDSVGVRTQDPQLRRIYEENVINYCSIMCYAVW